jgi:hypothetical protein
MNHGKWVVLQVLRKVNRDNEKREKKRLKLAVTLTMAMACNVPARVKNDRAD